MKTKLKTKENKFFHILIKSEGFHDLSFRGS